MISLHTGHVAARVRMNRLTADAYHQAFNAIFQTVKSSHPHFKVGDTLKGIILYWSDQQLGGLEAAVGKEAAEKVTKGCQVHFTRSVKCVAERVNKGDPQGFKAFTTVAYTIPKANSPEDLSKLFNVLAGEVDTSTLAEVSGLSKTLKKFNHTPKSWKTAKHWVNWWIRPNYLSKFVLGCSLSVL